MADRVVETELTRGVRLTSVKAERFKTGCLSVTLLVPHTKKTASLNAVLPYVLRRGTARLTDMEALAAAMDDMYGARIEPAIRKKGEVSAVGFCADFPDGSFLPGRHDILSDVAYLTGELLLTPATRGGRLRGDFVASERQNLLDDIAAEINDKRSYAGLRLCENMFRGESYGVSKLGTAAGASAVTAQTLTAHYREVISTAPIEVFYCGAEEPERVAGVLREALAALPRTGSFTVPSTSVRTAFRGGEKIYRETVDVTQGRLIMGFRLQRTMEDPNYAAMAVMNALLGGSPTSRLFLNVRERLALCYYASSALDRHKGALFVSAGIDFDKFDEVHGEVLRELEAIAGAAFEPWELEAAKRAVVSSLLASLDDPMGLEELYLDRAILGYRSRPEELAAMCELVTAEDVAKIAADARLTHTYFLTAEGEEC